jgi:hypothetical protein
MTFDIEKILAGKRTFRRTLAARDIGEKLRMLDALRERAVALRAAKPASPNSPTLEEKPKPYIFRR